MLPSTRNHNATYKYIHNMNSGLRMAVITVLARPSISSTPITEAVEEAAAAELKAAGDVLELEEGLLPLTVEDAVGVGEGGVGGEALEDVAGAEREAGFERLEGEVVLGVVVTAGEHRGVVGRGSTADADDVEVGEEDPAERDAFSSEEIDLRRLFGAEGGRTGEDAECGGGEDGRALGVVHGCGRRCPISCN